MYTNTRFFISRILEDASPKQRSWYPKQKNCLIDSYLATNLEQGERAKVPQNQGECSKAPRDETVHAKGSLDQTEHSKGPRDQNDHAKGSRDQVVHAKGPQDQQAAKPDQVGKGTDTVQEGSATPKYDAKGNSLVLDKEYQRFMDAVMVEANLNKDSGCDFLI